MTTWKEALEAVRKEMQIAREREIDPTNVELIDKVIELVTPKQKPSESD